MSKCSSFCRIIIYTHNCPQTYSGLNYNTVTTALLNKHITVGLLRNDCVCISVELRLCKVYTEQQVVCC